MDLFGDLPEPSNEENKVDKHTAAVNKDVMIHQSNKTITEENYSLKRNISLVEDEATDEGLNKKPAFDATEKFKLKGYNADRKGEREEMQDAHSLIDNFLSEIEKPPTNVLSASFYAVFDGHGGMKASNYSSQNLHKIITHKFPKGGETLEKDVRRCLVESFKKLDEDFLNEARQKKPSWKDGSTAVAVLAINNTLFIGNLGDSKAVLCRYNESSNKYAAVPLTVDHNPTLYEERMRIQKAGGHVREGRVMGLLEVSRSIGDGSFKKHGVSCIPDVKRCQLTLNDRYVLIACDGLWKRFDNDSAIEFINNILNDDQIKGTDTKEAKELRWETACNRLANEAVRRLSADNVTVLLVSIDHV